MPFYILNQKLVEKWEKSSQTHFKRRKANLSVSSKRSFYGKKTSRRTESDEYIVNLS